MTDNVKVAIRCRPLSEKEISDGYEAIVRFEPNNKVLVEGINDEPGSKRGDRRSFLREYQFDQTFDWNASQEEIYDSSCRPIVDSVLQGYNGTIFAYGQTGTGKTYTMEGAGGGNLRQRQRKGSSAKLEQSINNNDNGDDSKLDDNEASLMQKQSTIGMIPRAFKHIFKHIAEHQDIQYLVRVSYLEIYQENIHDLLRKDQSIKLELHERPDIGVYVKDLTSFFCKSITEIERVMRVGNQNRRVAATDMNEHSSRSHAIFMVTIEQQQQMDQVSKRKNSSRIIKVGKLNLIDLAGSESQKKTNSFGQRQKESVKINLSLSALGNVINSLMKANTNTTSQQQTASIHTPYRDSKLTRLLQDSLGGNAKTLMIANIGPASYNYDETINTLNYASRAKLIRNKPRLNEDPKDALLRELQKEIDDLRHKLAEIDSNTNTTTTNSSSLVESTTKFNNNNKQTSKPLETKLISNNNEDDINDDDDQQSIEQELISLKSKLASLESKLLNNNEPITTRTTQDSDDYLQINNRHAMLTTTTSGKRQSSSSSSQSMLEDYMRRQEEELRAKQVELAKQSNRENAIRDELERNQELELLTKESFSSTQHELDAKKRLIRQILLKVKQMRDSIEADESAYRLELDELDQLQYELGKELKLKCLIMDNFIPNHHVGQLLPRISYHEQTSACVLRNSYNINKCLLDNHKEDDDDCVIGFDEFWQKILSLNDRGTTSCKVRPKTEFERLEETLFPGNIRFKCDRFIETGHFCYQNEPDSSLSTNSNTRPTEDDYCENGKADTKLQDLLNESLDAQEPDIVI